MKWQNRGHEFDELGAWFQGHRVASIYIYTYGGFAHTIAQSLTFLQLPIFFIKPKSIKSRVKNEVTAKCKGLEGKTVPLSAVLGEPDGKIVLIPSGYPDAEDIFSMLEEGGFQRNRNVFLSGEFFSTYFPVYCLYVHDVLYFPSISFLCTTVCNLNCEKCLNFKPYSRSVHHRPLEELKADLDRFFSCVDFVKRFHVSGGEPFLYPQLAELITYIGTRYRNQIGDLETVTNCTVMPDENLCRVLREYRVCVECDDYRQLPSAMRKSFAAVQRALDAHGICSRVLSHHTWLDLFPPKEPFHLLEEDELARRFCKCDQPFMELRNGRLYSCNYMGYAITAGLIPDCAEDTYDLDGFVPAVESRRELLEFRCRYTQKGYVEFCKYCNGFPEINPNRAVPAKQAEGILSWEKPEDQ